MGPSVMRGEGKGRDKKNSRSQLDALAWIIINWIMRRDIYPRECSDWEEREECERK